VWLPWSPGELFSLLVTFSGLDLYLLDDGVQENDELSGDWRDCGIGVLAPGGEPPEPLWETQLGFPADVSDGLRKSFDAVLDDRGDLGTVAPGAGGLGEGTPGGSVSGFGDAALATRVAVRGGGGDQGDEGGEVAGVVEADEVAELGEDRGWDDPRNAAQRPEGFDDGDRTRPWSESQELVLDRPKSLDLFVNGADGFLEDDRLGGGRKTSLAR